MREFITPFVGPGYREDTRGWLDPTAFIKAHRGASEDDVGRPLPPGSSAPAGRCQLMRLPSGQGFAQGAFKSRANALADKSSLAQARRSRLFVRISFLFRRETRLAHAAREL